MAEPPRSAANVAPNLVGQVHPPNERLRLGHIQPSSYPGHFVTGGEALFWVWVPTRDGGTLTIRLAPGQTARIRILRGKDRTLGQVNGASSLSVEVPQGEHGRFEVLVLPATVDVKATFTQTAWSRDGAKPLIPWNFWYFPYRPAAGSTYPSRDVQLSAIAKWDRVLDPTGVGGHATRYETDHHVSDKPSTSAWEGHCDGAVAASIYLELPKPVPPFTFDELMLLASEWAGNRTQVEARDWRVEGTTDFRLNLKYAGNRPPCGHVLHLLRPDDWLLEGDQLSSIAVTRYNESYPRAFVESGGSVALRAFELLGTEPARRKVKEALGAAALGMIRFVDDRLKVEGHPLVAEIGSVGGSAAAIWNHVLFFSRREWIETPPPAGAAGDPRAVDVILDLAFNDDRAPMPWLEVMPATVVGGAVTPTPREHLEIAFALRLRFSSNGDLIANDVDHLIRAWPRGRWFPRQLQVLAKPSPRATELGEELPFNGHVDDRVLSYLELRGRYR